MRNKPGTELNTTAQFDTASLSDYVLQIICLTPSHLWKRGGFSSCANSSHATTAAIIFRCFRHVRNAANSSVADA